MTRGVTLHHEHSLSPSTLFFPIRSHPKQHPQHGVLSGLPQILWRVLIEIIVWYDTEPPLCLSSYLYYGVTGWYTHSTEIFAGRRVLGMYPDTAPWLLSLRDLKVAGYGVLCFINKYSCSRVASYLV